MKLCSMCNIEKDESEFRYRNKKKTTLQCWGRDCERVWIKKWKKDNKEHIKIRDRKYYDDNRMTIWAKSTIYGHNKRRFNMLITKEELVIVAKNTTHCRICGNKLDYTGTDNLQARPTLDIIDPSNVDITLDKIQIVCHRCNMSKGTMSEKEFVLYCSRISKLHGDKYGVCN
jgi:hypothetical protein